MERLAKSTELSTMTPKPISPRDDSGRQWFEYTSVFVPQDSDGNWCWTDMLTLQGIPAAGIDISRRLMTQQYHDLISLDRDEVMEKFVWFINERETIRHKKEAGDSRPYTDDPILDLTKFTNIFREDDKVSKLIFNKVWHLQGVDLVRNLLIARLVNRCDILSDLLPWDGSDISYLLAAPFTHPGAYQISPGISTHSKKNYGTHYPTVREVIVYETANRAEAVHDAILSTTDITEAVLRGNEAFGGGINFIMFQVVLDYAYVAGHFNDTDSVVRVGQGGKAIVDLLMNAEFNASSDIVECIRPKKDGIDVSSLLEEVNSKVNLNVVKRPLLPLDLEHAMCEFRKYLYRQGRDPKKYSYVENSLGV